MSDRNVYLLNGAGTPLIVVRSADPINWVGTLESPSTSSVRYAVVSWGMGRGFQNIHPRNGGIVTLPDSPMPDQMLEAFKDIPRTDPPTRLMVVAWNLLTYADNNPVTLQKLLDILPKLKDMGHTIVAIQPTGYQAKGLLANYAEYLDPDAPTAEALAKVGTSTMKGTPWATEMPTATAEALCGLTAWQAEQAVAETMLKTRTAPDFKSLLSVKEVVVNKNPALHLVTETPSIEDVKGLDRLKKFATKCVRDPRSKGILLLGVPGCLHEDTPILDPVAGTVETVGERFEKGTPFHVYSKTPEGKVVVALADPPKKFEPAGMVKLTLSTGESVTVTLGHKIWDGLSWGTAEDICQRMQESAPVLLPTISESSLSTLLPNAERLTDTLLGFQDGYRFSAHSCGEPLPPEVGTSQAFVPSQDGVPPPDPFSCDRGDLENTPSNTLSALSDHQPTRDSGPQPRMKKVGEVVSRLFSKLAQPALGYFQEVLRLRADVFQTGTSPLLLGYGGASNPSFHSFPKGDGSEATGRCEFGKPHKSPRVPIVPDLAGTSGTTPQVFLLGTSDGPCHTSYTQEYTTQVSQVVKAEPVGVHPYYDFHVPGTNTYWAQGMWHHNTGKSMCCGAIANASGLPLIEFNLSAVFGSLVGQSEGNMRQALDTIKAVAPCVLLVDEVEKALSGTKSSSATDGGTTERVAREFLMFLQNRPKGVYIVATCNDVSKLPPEYLRAERWDTLWFVDLPTESERVEIFNLYRKQYGLKDTSVTATSLEGWTGAEIHTLCRLASILGEKLSVAKQYVVPLSKTMKEDIKKLQEWAKGRCVPASMEAPVETSAELSQTTGGRLLDLSVGTGDSKPN